jgi:ribosome-binding factor A
MPKSSWDMSAPRISVKAANYLSTHRGEIQKEMSSRVVMKYSPQVKFSFDDSIEKGNNVLSIIDELEHSEDSPS